MPSDTSTANYLPASYSISQNRAGHIHPVAAGHWDTGMRFIFAFIVGLLLASQSAAAQSANAYTRWSTSCLES
jgi:hypothetical protein